MGKHSNGWKIIYSTANKKLGSIVLSIIKWALQCGKNIQTFLEIKYLPVT